MKRIFTYLLCFTVLSCTRTEKNNPSSVEQVEIIYVKEEVKEPTMNWQTFDSLHQEAQGDIKKLVDLYQKTPFNSFEIIEELKILAPDSVFLVKHLYHLSKDDESKKVLWDWIKEFPPRDFSFYWPLLPLPESDILEYALRQEAYILEEFCMVFKHIHTEKEFNLFQKYVEERDLQSIFLCEALFSPDNPDNHYCNDPVGSKKCAELCADTSNMEYWGRFQERYGW